MAHHAAAQAGNAKTDDTPYGGGKGMLMATQPICDCFKAVCEKQPQGKRYVIYASNILI